MNVLSLSYYILCVEYMALCIRTCSLDWVSVVRVCHVCQWKSCQLCFYNTNFVSWNVYPLCNNIDLFVLCILHAYNVMYVAIILTLVFFLPSAVHCYKYIVISIVRCIFMWHSFDILANALYWHFNSKKYVPELWQWLTLHACNI